MSSRVVGMHTGLTEDDILAIRASNKWPIVLAREYGISKQMVSGIQLGHFYKNIGGRIRQKIKGASKGGDIKVYFRLNYDVSDSGCWVWNRTKNLAGYGYFWWAGVRYFAHRYSYEERYGVFDKSLFVCHKCDNPSCVNPEHLFLGTCLDNVLDCIAKGRNVKGSKVGTSVLTEEKVIEMRKRYAQGDITIRGLARLYGEARITVNDAIKRKSWKHIP